jgi:hypothetical protein
MLWGKRKLRPAVGLSYRYHHLTLPDTAANAQSVSSELKNRERMVPLSGD